MDRQDIIHEGKPARLYANGDIRDLRGRIVKLGDDRMRQYAITSETAHEFHQKRKEKILKAIEAGVMRVTDAPDPYAAISRIVEKRAEVALQDNNKAGNDAARIVLQALDALQDRRQETTVTNRQEYSIDPDTMRIVEGMMRARRDFSEENIINIE